MSGTHPENSLAWLAEQLGVAPAAVYRASHKVADRADSKVVGRHRVYRPSAIVRIRAEVLRDKRRVDALPRDSAGLFQPKMGRSRPRKVLISLTEDQYRQVLELAQEKGKTVTELITEVVLESWLFDKREDR